MEGDVRQAAVALVAAILGACAPIGDGNVSDRIELISTVKVS